MYELKKAAPPLRLKGEIIMTDEQIVKLYLDRDETALVETRTMYGKLLQSVAFNILHNKQDAEECENETCLRAWNSIPPNKPQRLCAYLCKIARRLALDKYDYNHAAKRGTALPLEELSECLASAGCAEDRLTETAFAEIINGFLAKSDRDTRVIFMQRFWFGYSIAEIAQKLNASESKVKTRISRTLKKLREHLRKEGYDI